MDDLVPGPVHRQTHAIRSKPPPHDIIGADHKTCPSPKRGLRARMLTGVQQQKKPKVHNLTSNIVNFLLFLGPFELAASNRDYPFKRTLQHSISAEVSPVPRISITFKYTGGIFDPCVSTSPVTHSSCLSGDTGRPLDFCPHCSFHSGRPCSCLSPSWRRLSVRPSLVPLPLSRRPCYR